MGEVKIPYHMSPLLFRLLYSKLQYRDQIFDQNI